MIWHNPRTIIITSLSILLLSVYLVTAQDDGDLPIRDTLVMGDTISMTLDPDERVYYEIDLPTEFTALLQNTGESEYGSDWWAQLLNSEGQVMLAFDLDNPEGLRLAKYSSGINIIHIYNRTDIATEVQFTLTEMPSREITFNERIVLTEEESSRMEFTFSLDDPQAVTFIGQPQGYVIEQILEDRIRQRNAYGSLDMYDGVHGTILEAGEYRVFVGDIWQPGSNDDEMPFIEVRPVEIISGELTISELVDATADNQPVQYTIDLVEDDAFYAGITSSGAHAYITDEDGEVLEYFGHSANVRELIQLSFVAPETGIYTLHILNPLRGEAMFGEFLLATSHAEFPSTGETSPIDIRDSEMQFIVTALRASRYRLTIHTVDGNPITGAIAVEVLVGPEPYYDSISLDEDPAPRQVLVSAELRDTDSAEYTFDTSISYGGTMIVLQGLDDVEASVIVTLESIQDEE